MADYKLIGKPYSTADLVAKVTGRAKYAEDFRAEGMLFAKLLVSPMPHGRVRRIDTSAAEALPGVVAILTAADLPPVDAPNEAALTNEPRYEGEPILAVAAVDETTAADAVELIRLDLEPLPFVLDPLESLRPGGPNARLDGNTMTGTDVTTVKWEGADWAAAERGEFPAGGAATDEWQVATSRRGSRRRISYSTRRCSISPCRTSRSRRAAPWRTGSTASAICTPPPRAPPARTARRRG